MPSPTTPVGSSPDGQSIAFSSYRCGNQADIFLMPATGEASSACPSDTLAPSIDIASPQEGYVYMVGEVASATYSCADDLDGLGLVSCAGNVPVSAPLDTATAGDKTFTVTAIDAAGNEHSVQHAYRVVDTLSRVTDRSAGAYCGRISPDGVRIAFADASTGNIYVANRDGTGEQQVANVVLDSPPCPEWSPDSSKLLFVSSAGGNGEIYTAGAAGGNVTNLTDHSGPDFLPAWSPDGQEIYFVTTRDAPVSDYPDAELYVMDADGSNQTRLTNKPNYYESSFSVSPDGTRIAVARVSLPPNPPGAAGIALVDTTTGSVSPLVTDATATAPRWSPNGQWIAFGSTPTPGEPHLNVVDADGSNRLDVSQRFADRYEWAPDSSRLAFASFDLLRRVSTRGTTSSRTAMRSRTSPMTRFRTTTRRGIRAVPACSSRATGTTFRATSTSSIYQGAGTAARATQRRRQSRSRPPRTGRSSRPGSPCSPTFACSDGSEGSGIVRCEETSGIQNGDPLTTFYLDDFVVTVVAEDGAGNEATLSHTYTVVEEVVAETLAGPGTVSTDTELDGASPDDPVETSVTTPVGGDVTIAEAWAPYGPPPTGYSFLTESVRIEAPPATPGQSPCSGLSNRRDRCSVRRGRDDDPGGT